MTRTPTTDTGVSRLGWTPLILASLFFFLSACFHSCDAYAQSVPLPAGSKLTKPRLSDEDIQILVTDEDGYWINESTARACLVQEQVAAGCVDKWKACEKSKQPCPSGSRLSAYAIGVLAGVAMSLAFVLVVQR